MYLLADGGSQVGGRRAVVDLVRLARRTAVAVCIIGLAVESLAALTSIKDIVVSSEGVTELGAELVCGRCY